MHIFPDNHTEHQNDNTAKHSETQSKNDQNIDTCFTIHIELNAYFDIHIFNFTQLASNTSPHAGGGTCQC